MGLRVEATYLKQNKTNTVYTDELKSGAPAIVIRPDPELFTSSLHLNSTYSLYNKMNDRLLTPVEHFV